MPRARGSLSKKQVTTASKVMFLSQESKAKAFVGRVTQCSVIIEFNFTQTNVRNSAFPFRENSRTPTVDQ